MSCRTASATSRRTIRPDADVPDARVRAARRPGDGRAPGATRGSAARQSLTECARPRRRAPPWRPIRSSAAAASCWPMNQREQELKFEIVAPIASDEKPTAIISFNYHQDHFGAALRHHDRRRRDGAHGVRRLRPRADRARAVPRGTASTAGGGRRRCARRSGVTGGRSGRSIRPRYTPSSAAPTAIAPGRRRTATSISGSSCCTRCGLEPLAALPFTLAIDFEGDQWTFFKFPLADLDALYGVDVFELNVWRPLVDHLEEQLALGRPALVEVDAFYLPDTAGTSLSRASTSRRRSASRRSTSMRAGSATSTTPATTSSTGEDFAGALPSRTSV